ncbi:hypothetical protein [uncultured Draconibacterium sp.]|uniref:hypothetical protein n=1 Tax=uncultured Draconibacterium sp. TaxID=1573823 RepID=UPI0029C79398|nr:hypothetical protein [uncultured Draconibacterium sp.]
MNKIHEQMATMVIDLMKQNNGSMTKSNLSKSIKDLENNRFPVIGGLKDIGLIVDLGSYSYRLTDKGWKFESFEKLNYESSIEIRLAESNIKANKLNERNSKYIKYGFIANLIFAIINVLIAIL